MDWFIDLLKPGNVSLASTILLYSFVIFTGIFLGKVKILGVSLGVTFVLFVGILLGHLRGRSQHASFSPRIRTYSFYFFNRYASWSRILLLFQRGGNQDEYACNDWNRP